MADRPEVLLTLAAEALDKGDDPLHVSFLSEHEVTLDEAYDLAENLALGARMVLEAWSELRQGGLVGIEGATRLAAALLAKERA